MTTRGSVALWAFMGHPTSGGEGGLGWNWARSYERHGYSVDLITSSTHRHATEQYLLSHPHEGIRVHYIDVDEATFNRGQSERFTFLIDYLRWQRQALAYCLREGLGAAAIKHHVSLSTLLLGSKLSRLPPSFVFGPGGGGDLSATELRRTLGHKIIRDLLRTFTIRHLASYLPTVRNTLPATDLTLAANAHTQRLASRLGARHIELMIPDGIDSARVVMRPRVRTGDAPTVLWVARFMPRKAPRLALAAFRHALRQLPEAQLIMVGDGSELSETRRLARDLGIDSAVRFTGRLAWASVIDLYDEADVFLFTSVRDTTSATAIEAAARALPMVTLVHSGGGGCEQYPDVGAIKVRAVPTETVASRLGDALSDVLRESPTYRDRSQAMLEFARNNTWDAKVNRLTQSLNSS